MADQQVVIPDLGGAGEVTVIEVLVKSGDRVKKEQSLITLEGEKATMDVPSPFSGTVKNILVKVGDKVEEGKSILIMEISEDGAKNVDKTDESPKKSEKFSESIENKVDGKEKMDPAVKPRDDGPSSRGVTQGHEETQAHEQAEAHEVTSQGVHAGPAVRRIAHEFGVDLTKISGTGPKQRIVKEDVQQYVKNQLRIAESKATGTSLPAAPVIDFSKFGAIEKRPLTKIKRISGTNLTRNWMTIPHVTQFAEADITELEEFRQSQKKITEADGIRLTPLVFIMKAVIAALKQFPHFNASLEANGENLILKKYFHIGVAVDTPDGLVVPVIRNVDCKSLSELAKELAEISQKARTKGLNLTDMQGGCFSISSLGGIGGSAFTPIINAPEVAILGISRMAWKPIYQNQHEFKMRLMLPLSLSYDHRVIDGADGARFIMSLIERLSEIRTLLL